MTKLEILDETVQCYASGLKSRAIHISDSSCDGEVGLVSCKYLTREGKMCAVGRCCIAPQENWIGRAGNIRDKKDAVHQPLEEILKPEYRGHKVVFWVDLQLLHDGPANFTYNGYSKVGLDYIAAIKKNISEGNYD